MALLLVTGLIMTTVLRFIQVRKLKHSYDVIRGKYDDPSHDGEGWILEVIDETTAVVYWFSYDSNGEQVWMISMADIDNNGIAGELLSTSGPVFGQDFNPDDVRYEDWGTLTMSFADCNLARVEYDSPLAEFGSGGLLPQRLTSLSGLPCHEAPNILMVIADDFGVDAFGAYGLNDAAAATPVLDEMAASGLQVWRLHRAG